MTKFIPQFFLKGKKPLHCFQLIEIPTFYYNFFFPAVPFHSFKNYQHLKITSLSFLSPLFPHPKYLIPLYHKNYTADWQARISLLFWEDG